jgi:uncharacterized protein (TIRG00374 family)
VALAIVFVLKRLPRLASVSSLLLHVRWMWLLCGVVLEGLSMCALSLLQQRLLGVTGARVAVTRLVPITLAANAVSLSVPGGVVVAEGYAFKQYRRLGASPVGAGWVEAAAGSIAAAALASLAFAGAVIVGGGLRNLLVGPFAVVVVGSALAAYLLYKTTVLSMVATAVVTFGERHSSEGVRARLGRIEQATARMVDITPSPKVWWTGAAAASSNWLLDAIVLACAILSVGHSVPWQFLLLVYAGGQVIAMIPITPGGLGIVEGGLIGLLGRAHMQAAPATAAVLVYRGLSFWLLLAVGWVAAARLRLKE